MIAQFDARKRTDWICRCQVSDAKTDTSREIPARGSHSRLLLILGVWKAHGNAAGRPGQRLAEPRRAGLIQNASRWPGRPAKAVLEQPSSRRVTGYALGRRNIALWQNHELDRESMNEIMLSRRNTDHNCFSTHRSTSVSQG